MFHSIFYVKFKKENSQIFVNFFDNKFEKLNWICIRTLFPQILHCLNKTQPQNFFRYVFSRFRTECGYSLAKSLYSLQMQVHTDQKNCIFKQFSHSVI